MNGRLFTKADQPSVVGARQGAVYARNLAASPDLLPKNQEEALTAAETADLEQLRIQMDKWVLRRSYALALLKWRGYTLPAA